LALRFLANILTKQPAFDPLEAGESIAGTLTNALPITAGERWQSRYEYSPYYRRPKPS
jgi:hypothetical protein